MDYHRYKANNVNALTFIKKIEKKFFLCGIMGKRRGNCVRNLVFFKKRRVFFGDLIASQICLDYLC